MDLTVLLERIRGAYQGDPTDFEALLNEASERSELYPFNKFEFMLTRLVASGGISYETYLVIRQDYFSGNLYLHLFEISAPTVFGNWAVQWLLDSFSQLERDASYQLERPTVLLDPEFDTEYDLLFQNENHRIKIEVKASRAVKFRTSGPLVSKALPRNTTYRYDMNFQQLKPLSCDVFVWFAVFWDEILIWVLNNYELTTNPRYSERHHRGGNDEGQLHITNRNINEFTRYELGDMDIDTAILAAYNRLPQSS